MAKTLAEIAMSLNIAKSSVQNRLPQIFLCGGPLQKSGKPLVSLRAVLLALLETDYPGLRSSVILAEEAADWYHSPKSPHFPNLVDLEKQIGALSTLILLIVESAGSIAELGAFSFISSLRAKLAVVLEGNYQHDRSFIMEGPVAMVEEENKAHGGATGWYSFDWLKMTKKPMIDPLRAGNVAERIVKEILDPAIKKMSDTELFRAETLEHQILLVADLVSVSGPLLITEIMEMLDGLDLRTKEKIEQKRVEEYLFILENLGHLTKTRASNYYFYVPPKRDLNFISYVSISGKPVRRDGLAMGIRAVLKALPNHDYRKLAFKNAAKKSVTP